MYGRGMMDGTPALTAFRAFRAALYACFTRRRDALFELTDALVAGSLVASPVHLSLGPVQRRAIRRSNVPPEPSPSTGLTPSWQDPSRQPGVRG